jgi:hypothetical protein
MTTNLNILVNKALPAIANKSVTYNADRNMFLTSGYTSQAGHTYFQGIQLSDRVAIVCSIGRGGWGTNPLFLNEVSVYCFDGTKKVLIGSWSPIDYEFYSEARARMHATQLLYDHLTSQARMSGISISNSELEQFAAAQIRAAVLNRPALN